MSTRISPDRWGWMAQVHTTHASYVLHAETRDDAERWLAAMTREIKGARGE